MLVLDRTSQPGGAEVAGIESRALALAKASALCAPLPAVRRAAEWLSGLALDAEEVLDDPGLEAAREWVSAWAADPGLGADFRAAVLATQVEDERRLDVHALRAQRARVRLLHGVHALLTEREARLRFAGRFAALAIA